MAEGGNKTVKVALAGNPNNGKSTLFNALTGLFQKTGNFPGVTVEKKVGSTRVFSHEKQRTLNVEIVDLPGIYSLYPKSLDENEAFKVLCDPENADHPDLIVVVGDASNLRRSLLLCTQIIDLRMPVILALNMIDVAEKNGIVIDKEKLAEKLGIEVFEVNAREGKGVDQLKKQLTRTALYPKTDFLQFSKYCPDLLTEVQKQVTCNSPYSAFQVVKHIDLIPYFQERPDLQGRIRKLIDLHKPDIKDIILTETLERYDKIDKLVNSLQTVTEVERPEVSISERIDKVLTHKIWGFIIFAAIMLVVFQSIFAWSAYPMDLIDSSFGQLSDWLNTTMPPGIFTDLVVGGLIPGLSGVLMFIPQIAILFGFIAILEDTGYMARVSFIMDRLLSRFGLNGRSVIPLISGMACAVPAIMSARTISNRKERLITILVTPLMSCSARLPVYTLMIALVIPSTKIFGFINLQGLTFFALYMLGFVAAITTALVLKYIIRSKERSVFIMEMPIYRTPKVKTVVLTMYNKAKVFVTDAGLIIIAISIVLWVASSHGPASSFEAIDKKYTALQTPGLDSATTQKLTVQKNSDMLVASYAGIMGKKIEPIVKPLGFDWKIGIALVTSFAAREVYVGTMSTIYSVENKGSYETIRERMKNDIDPATGRSRYTMALGLSIMVFYVFALQCMSTLAVMFRETRSWYIPLLQFIYMGALAYLGSWAVWNIFS
jgi:ferrous iron transport protein B